MREVAVAQMKKNCERIREHLATLVWGNLTREGKVNIAYQRGILWGLEWAIAEELKDQADD